MNSYSVYWFFSELKKPADLMGVIDIYNTASLCMIKANNADLRYAVSPRISRLFGATEKRFASMASAVPVKHVNNEVEGRQPLTGDSFIRPHLRHLAPYQPILPFEVFEANPLHCTL